VWRLPTRSPENGSSNPRLIAGPIRVDELMDRIVCKQPLLMRFEIDLACCTRCDPPRSRVDVATQVWILPGRLICDVRQGSREQTEMGEEEPESGLEGHHRCAAFLLNDGRRQRQRGPPCSPPRPAPQGSLPAG
jgi:hypothetical protein